MVPAIVQNCVLNQSAELLLNTKRVPLRILYVIGLLFFSIICLGLFIIFARKKWSLSKHMEAPNAGTTIIRL